MSGDIVYWQEQVHEWRARAEKAEAENERMRTAIRRLDGIIEFAEPVVVYNELIELRDLAQRRGR